MEIDSDLSFASMRYSKKKKKENKANQLKKQIRDNAISR